MRSLIRLVLVLMLAHSAPLLAGDVMLSIAGSVGVFRTDTAIVNPSFDKDIEVRAWFLPVGNVNNAAIASGPPVRLAVAKRQMRVFEDSVQSIFNATGLLGAILLSSDDQFIANSRIYAQTPNGTLGQFVPGLSPGFARTKGALIGLKSNAAFRTNIGLASQVNAETTVTWQLYNKTTLIATGSPIKIQPFGVIAPTNIASGFFFNPGSADLSDAWVSFTSDQPIFAYASVVDNGTTDPTFITASEDPGVPPPQQQTKVFNVTARSFAFVVQEGEISVRVGDRVIILVTGQNTTHGFAVERYAPIGVTVAPGQTREINFVATDPGSFTYFCTVPTCGTGSPGHLDMEGTMTVAP